MNHAIIEKSPRLQRTLKLLRTGREYSTKEVSRGAHIEAVSATISELRAQGVKVDCNRRKTNGRLRWYYRMRRSA